LEGVGRWFVVERFMLGFLEELLCLKELDDVGILPAYVHQKEARQSFEGVLQEGVPCEEARYGVLFTLYEPGDGQNRIEELQVIRVEEQLFEAKIVVEEVVKEHLLAVGQRK